MSFLYDHEWFFFIVSEGLTWVSILLLLITRYKFNFIRLSQLFLTIIILCTIFQAVLVGIDYSFTGKISLFQVVIILFIIYASTLGSSDIQRLDKYLQQKFNNKRVTFDDDIYAYIKYRKQLFAIHSCAFIIIHVIWILIDDNPTLDLNRMQMFFFNESLFYTIPSFFNNKIFNIISYFWSIVYILDVCVLIIYSVFRKQLVIKKR